MCRFDVCIFVVQELIHSHDHIRNSLSPSYSFTLTQALILSHSLTQCFLLSYLHFILGEDFYGAYDAQNFAIENSAALGVTPVPSLNLVYTQEEVRTCSTFVRTFLSLSLFLLPSAYPLELCCTVLCCVC